jgi:hypothetical protein
VKLPDIKQLKADRKVAEHQRNEARFQALQAEAQQKEETYKAIAQRILDAVPELMNQAVAKNANGVVIGKCLNDVEEYVIGRHPDDPEMPKEHDLIFTHIKQEIEKDNPGFKVIAAYLMQVGMEKMYQRANPQVGESVQIPSKIHTPKKVLGTEHAGQTGNDIILVFPKNP